jgi:hypothetical protein
LDGIDNDGLHFERLSRRKNLFDRHLRINVKHCGFHVHAFATHLDLLRRLLAGRIENLCRIRKTAGDVQHQSGLAYTRVSAQ